MALEGRSRSILIYGTILSSRHNSFYIPVADNAGRNTTSSSSPSLLFSPRLLESYACFVAHPTTQLKENMSDAGFLSAARYGKDKVRVLRVVREPESKVHHIVEYNVTVLLEGDIETR